MATTDTSVSKQPEKLPNPAAETEEDAQSPYEQVRTRLRGTVKVLGDIVNSDPELWV